MESKIKVIMTFIVLVFIITGLYFFADWFSKTTGYLFKEDPDNELAKCLTKKGAILYSSESCSDCKQQKALFGSTAFDFINHMDCSENTPPCSSLKSIPAWKINNTILYGVKTTQELRVLSGCNKS